jgi:hypothetical protein
MMSTMSWTEFQPYLAERLTRVIESKPEVLLEHDGGPEGPRADIILAMLYGMDGQVDAIWRVARAEPYLLRAVAPTLRAMLAETEPSPHLNTARYSLQSNWATMTLDWTMLREALPDDVHPAPGTSTVSVALLRYRHRI